MKDLTLENVTDAVVKSVDGTEDARLKELMTIFIRKAHEAVQEANLTHGEWERLVGFLHRAGDISNEQRNEFILLSDVFGITSLIDLMSASEESKATEPSVLGPFYMSGAPMLEPGGDLIGDNGGDRVVVQGRVLTVAGDPIPGAMLEFWQNADNGLYHNIDPSQDKFNLSCRMMSADDGSYSVSTIQPIPYQVPDDGPGGEFIRASGRHCWRPAHLHVRVNAEGCKNLVTEVFNTQDKYVEEDATFGVRASLVTSFDRAPTEDERTRFAHVAAPFHMVDFDFVLQPADP